MYPGAELVDYSGRRTSLIMQRLISDACLCVCLWQVHTHHTLSMDAGVTGLTDVTGLSATTWPVTIAYVALRTRTYWDVGPLKM